jgi:hypothetical protein
VTEEDTLWTMLAKKGLWSIIAMENDSGRFLISLNFQPNKHDNKFDI